MDNKYLPEYFFELFFSENPSPQKDIAKDILDTASTAMYLKDFDAPSSVRLKRSIF